jgi:hypothetical protein
MMWKLAMPLLRLSSAESDLVGSSTGGGPAPAKHSLGISLRACPTACLALSVLTGRRRSCPVAEPQLLHRLLNVVQLLLLLYILRRGVGPYQFP